MYVVNSYKSIDMEKRFRNKKVFISGSSSGIGLQIAKTFSQKGCKVGLNGVNKLRLKKAQDSIINSELFNYDVFEDRELGKLRKKVKQKFNKLDFLICNVGKSNFDLNHKDIKYAFNANFFSAVNLISFLGYLIKPNGRIICISSICGLEYLDGAPYGYSIAKSALNSYVKCFSRMYAKKKITLNAIAPGNIMFKNSVWEKKLKKNKIKTNNYIKKNVPLERFGQATEIADLCFYLCSDEASYINGSIIPIDGGQTGNF